MNDMLRYRIVREHDQRVLGYRQTRREAVQLAEEMLGVFHTPVQDLAPH